MAGTSSRKRNHKDMASSKLQRPKKKQKKSQQYHSDSEEGSNPDFQPVNLLDSDNEDLEHIAVDEVASLSGSNSASSGSDTDGGARSRPATRQRKLRKSKKPAKSDESAKQAPPDEQEDDDNENEAGEEGEEDDDDDDDDSDDYDDDDDEGADPAETRPRKSKSKRNDPGAFATSMSKILSSKLSGARKADPVLARSAEAHRAARDAVDSALEAKARRMLREQKRAALEKGRVRDVLAAAAGGDGGNGGESVGAAVQGERRLRKVAHRGVVMLFRAVREAQERALEADKGARQDVFGVAARQEKVSEMSRQGFLDLIAGGGGKLKSGSLEEA